MCAMLNINTHQQRDSELSSDHPAIKWAKLAVCIGFPHLAQRRETTALILSLTPLVSSHDSTFSPAACSVNLLFTKGFDSPASAATPIPPDTVSLCVVLQRCLNFFSAEA